MGLFSRTKDAYNKVKEGSSVNPFKEFKDIILGILGWIARIVGIAAFIWLVVMLTYTIPNSGGYQKYWLEAKTSVENVPYLGGFVRTVEGVFTASLDPEKFVQKQQEMQTQASVDQNVGNTDLGLRFESFKGQPDTFSVQGDNKYGANIVAVATGRIESLMDDSEVTFECDAFDGRIKGEVVNPVSSIQVKKNRMQFFNAKCSYDGNDFEMSDNLQTSYTLRMKANYDFNTIGSLTIYTMKAEVFDAKYEQNSYSREKIFEDEGIEDNKLDKSTGKVESTYTYGPVKVILNGMFNQPLNEYGPFQDGGPYTLQIILRRNENWDGTLVGITNIYLSIVDDINLESDNFDYVSEYVNEEGAFKKYKLKDNYVEELNNRCLNNNVFDINCWSGNNIATDFDFSVDINNDKINQRFIRIEVEYEYQAQTQEVITFIKTDFVNTV
ncbi:MAG: hypothetical protein V1663_00185 [archaeon]